MSTRLLFLILGLVAADTMAAGPGDPIVGQQLAAPKVKSPGAAASGKPAPAARVVSPTLNVTRVTRNADGTLTISCTDQPNPKAQAIRRTASPRSSGGDQP